MMPDLGKYAVTVLSAYAGTLVVLFALLALTFRRGRKIRAEMDPAEARMRRDG